MSYEGEYAGYRALRRIAETDRVKDLLRHARVFNTGAHGAGIRLTPRPAPAPDGALPEFVFAIDGSTAEVDVKNGYPGAKVGYATVASVLLNLAEVDKLDESRPIDPREFRRTEEASTIDAAFPGSNVVTRTHTSARASFRETLYEHFLQVIFDKQGEQYKLIETFEHLLAMKPQQRDEDLARCPYNQDDECDQRVRIGRGITTCPCSHKRPIYPTDALRIHEGFRDYGPNLESLGEVMQVWERLMLVHLLRCMEKQGWLEHASRLAFVLDGPLAIFGHPAWLSAAISAELKRLNAVSRKHTGADLLILGVEKTGDAVTHFEEVDQTETPGETLFPSGSYSLLTDRYIKERIIFSKSTKRYGKDTYFGRKLFYKTKNGARIVASIPFLSDAQDTIETDDVSLYPQFGRACALLDKLVSSRYPNALAPIVSAHAQAAIPLQLGGKVLEQLARALMRDQ